MSEKVIDGLAKALSQAQGQIKGATRDSLNPHFKSKYADLASVWDACRKALTDNGLSIVQFTNVSDGHDRPVLVTRLLHVSGESVEGVTPLLMGKQDMQALGSAITYARRYGLAAMVGISPEDDDGNAAVEGTREPAKVALPPKPEGYDQWLQSFEESAALGLDTMGRAYSAGLPEFRKYLAATDPGLKDRLKAEATQADTEVIPF